MVKLLVLLSFVPCAYLVLNAESTFKKAGVKQLSSKRRERLDQEFGVNRDEMTDDYVKLDEAYRITEKSEIEKYKRLGKSSKQFYEDKEMRKEMEDQDKSDGGGSKM